MKKLFIPVILTMIFAAGCGYTAGSLAHPQLKSVAVAPVINDTLAFNASAIFRGLLNERFTTDGSLKLKSLETADCLVYARIKDVSYKAIGYGNAPDGSDTFLANEWRCTVSVEYSVILPGRARPLINNASVNGSSDFVTGPDLEVSRRNAMRQAFFTATKKIVSNVTEGW